MMGAKLPSPDEQKIMLKYLKSNALKSISEDSLSDAESDSAKAFIRECSRCHALPDPRQHTPDQWAAVVKRMQNHAQESQLPLIQEQDLKNIIRYLQDQSRKDQPEP